MKAQKYSFHLIIALLPIMLMTLISHFSQTQGKPQPYLEYLHYNLIESRLPLLCERLLAKSEVYVEICSFFTLFLSSNNNVSLCSRLQISQ